MRDDDAQRLMRRLVEQRVAGRELFLSKATLEAIAGPEMRAFSDAELAFIVRADPVMVRALEAAWDGPPLGRVERVRQVIQRGPR